MMSDIPYLPGGQRLILLSKELKVSKVILGA